MITYEWTSAVIAIVIAGAITVFVRHNRLHASNAAWWLLLAAAIVVLGIVPGIVDSIAVELGIYYPPILVVLVGIGVVLLKLLKIDIERSRQQREIRTLAQKVAILETNLREKESAEERQKTS